MTMKLLRVPLIVLLMSIFSAGQVTSPPKFKVVELKGSPYERGLQHGKLLKLEIHDAIATWKAGLRLLYKTDPDILIRKFAASTNYTPAIEKWTPDLLQEVHGIADGSGIDFTTVFVYQLPDEVPMNVRKIIASDHCSAAAVGATSDHPAIVAQNMDLFGYQDGAQTILQITEPSGLQQLVLTVPGLIASNGMNNRGVGITANTLSQLSHSREGLPVAFVIRGVLERTGFDAASEFVTAVRHASGQNFTIGGNGKVAYFEASANKVVRSQNVPDGAFIYHTNHPIVSDDFSGERESQTHKENTRDRYAALETRLAGQPSGDPVELIRKALSSQDSKQNPVSQGFYGPLRAFSFASTIMVLGPNPHLIAAPGPPHQTEYSVYRFTPR